MLLSLAVFTTLLGQPPKATPASRSPARPAASRPAPSPTAVPTAPSAPLPQVPFADGETSTYDVSWSAMSAGQATVSIRASRGPSGIDAWIVRADATPSAMIAALYSLRYHAESILDARTLLPRQGLVDSTEGGRRKVRRTAFDRVARKARVSMTIGDTVTRVVDIDAQAHDLLSALQKVRSLPLADGFRGRIAVAENLYRYSLEIVVAGRSTLKTPIGSLEAWKITPRIIGRDGKAQTSQDTLWLSADARRLLLRVDSTLAVGGVTLSLASYTPGRR